MDMGATGEVTMTPYRNRSQRLSARRSRGRGPADVPPWAGAGVSAIRSYERVGGEANFVGESDSRVVQVSARTLVYAAARSRNSETPGIWFDLGALLHALASGPHRLGSLGRRTPRLFIERHHVSHVVGN